MKNIINWTCGSFFRVIGRILAYLVIGGLIATLLSRSSFKITDLFFESVKAEQLEQQMLQFYSTTGAVSNSASITDDIEKNFYTYQGPFTLKMSGNFILRNQNDQYDSYRMFYAKIGFCVDTVNFLRAYKNGSGGTNNSVYDMALSVQDTNQKCYFNNNSSYDGHLAYVYISAILDSSIYDSSNHNIEYIIDQPITITNGRTDISYSVLLVSRVFGDSAQIIDNNDVYFNQIIQQQQATTNAINSQSQQQHQDSENTQSVINNGVNQTISTITDDTAPDVNSTLSNDALTGYLPPGPLDSVMTLPFQILNSLVNKMGTTCSPIVIPLPFLSNNNQLTIPCISTIFSSMPGLNVGLSAVFVIISGLFLYNYLLYLYNWVDDMTSLKHGRPRFFGANSDVDNWGGAN